jgi:imidazole glycerol-phosphate synthase subunit HisF
MLRKRIIFTLIYSHGIYNQSRNFRLQKVGNLNWLEKNYQFKKIAFSIDELIVLNSSKDEKLLFKSGADKIVLNSAFKNNPNLIRDLVRKYGSQSLVACIDYKNNNEHIEVFINDGTLKLDEKIEEYILYLESLQIGEIYLNSIDRDGTGFGYDFETIQKVVKFITKPLIIAGGAGNERHLFEGLQMNGVSAVSTANLFNFIGNGLPNARKSIIEKGENLANWINNVFD